MAWSKNQIILLVGVIVSILGVIVNFLYLFKTTDQQIIIKQDIDEIKSKVAEIETLKSKTAEIDNLKSEIAEINSLLAGNTSVGRFKSTCPAGTHAITVITPQGLEVVCQ